jgi:hypothetical protein
MSLPVVLPRIADRVLRTHVQVLFVVGSWDRVDHLIDVTRTAIVNHSTGNGRDTSNAHMILEPRGLGNVITLQRPRRSAVWFFQTMPLTLTNYGLLVVPDPNGSQSYLAMTLEEWQQLQNHPPEPPGPPPPSVWEWLRKPGV